MRPSGIAPNEPSELDQALEENVEKINSAEQQKEASCAEKQQEIDKEKETAEAVRRRAMERLPENRAREGCRKQKGGETSEDVGYLREEGSGHESKGKPSRFKKEKSLYRGKKSGERTLVEAERTIVKREGIEPEGENAGVNREGKGKFSRKNFKVLVATNSTATATLQLAATHEPCRKNK